MQDRTPTARHELRPDSTTQRPGSAQLAALAFTGLCVGIIAGLSASPAVHLIISAVLGLAGALLGVLKGLPGASDPSNPDQTRSAESDLSPPLFRLRLLCSCV